MEKGHLAVFVDYLLKGLCLDITSTDEVLYGSAKPQLLVQSFIAQTCKAAVTNCHDGLTTVYCVLDKHSPGQRMLQASRPSEMVIHISVVANQTRAVCLLT